MTRRISIKLQLFKMLTLNGNVRWIFLLSRALLVQLSAVCADMTIMTASWSVLRRISMIRRDYPSWSSNAHPALIITLSWSKRYAFFSTYSYSFILEALYAFYHGKHRYNKASTANDLGITRSRLSSWIEKFRSSAFLSRMATEYMNRSRSFELLELLDRLHAQQALFMRFLLGFIRKHHQPWLVRHVLLGTRIWCGAFFSSSNKTDM